MKKAYRLGCGKVSRRELLPHTSLVCYDYDANYIERERHLSKQSLVTTAFMVLICFEMHILEKIDAYMQFKIAFWSTKCIQIAVD